jgi:hypothetical protein
VIHAVSGIEVQYFDPVSLIQAVNALQAVGEKNAVAALRAYLARQASNRYKVMETDRVSLIARMLFKAKDPSHPIPRLRKGLDAVLSERLLEQYPDFPLVTVQGIPFLLGPTQAGESDPSHPSAEDPNDILDYCLEHAQFRTEALLPQVDPIHAVEHLMSSDLWADLRSARMSENLGTVELIRIQALMAMGRVMPCTFPDVQCVLGNSDIHHAEQFEAFWAQRISDVLKQDPKWDSSWQDFIPGRFSAPH